MKNLKIWLFMIAVTIGCKKPYSPNVIDSPKKYLVVEGVINTNDTTTIKISRTVNLSNAVTSNPVESAAVTIESDEGGSYPLYESSPGMYKSNDVFLPGGTRKYRLKINTFDDSKEYLSDFVPVKDAPPIDSVGFTVTTKGIQLYANTHDATSNTRYYRFDYVETWRFHSLYNSGWRSNGVDIVPRRADEQVYYCFKSHPSSSILVGSTAKLTQDILFQMPVTAIESTSEKIENKYSILLNQYALTAEAYKFWETLRKNTEQLGSIFDAEPTQLAGNIHNTKDNNDVVIGYISAGSVAKKRIFITAEQLPDTFKPLYPYECMLDTAYYDRPLSHGNEVASLLVPEIELAAYAFYKGGPNPAGFLGASPLCVDCTLRGTTKQPDFWK